VWPPNGPFFAQRLGRVNVAFDDKVGVGQNHSQFGQAHFKTWQFGSICLNANRFALPMKLFGGCPPLATLSF
jgi:hypothetical protein